MVTTRNQQYRNSAAVKRTGQPGNRTPSVAIAKEKHAPSVAIAPCATGAVAGGAGAVVVTKPTMIDVLSGRGDRTNRHYGNQLFRRAMQHFLPRFRMHSSNPIHSRIVAQSIIWALNRNGSRFLHSVLVDDDDEASASAATSSSVKKTKKWVWVEMSREEAVKKTVQALRDIDKIKKRRMKRATRATATNDKTVKTWNGSDVVDVDVCVDGDAVDGGKDMDDDDMDHQDQGEDDEEANADGDIDMDPQGEDDDDEEISWLTMGSLLGLPWECSVIGDIAQV